MIGNRAFGERTRRFADAALPRGRLRLPAAHAASADAVHGRGVRRIDAVPVFLRLRPRARRRPSRTGGGASSSASRPSPTRPPIARIPDPNAAATFEASKLRWAERSASPHRERLALVRELLALRRQRLAPHLPGLRHGGRYRIERGALHVAWDLEDGSAWRLLAHFGREAMETAQGARGTR